MLSQYVLEANTSKLKANFEVGGGIMDEKPTHPVIIDTDPVIEEAN